MNQEYTNFQESSSPQSENYHKPLFVNEVNLAEGVSLLSGAKRRSLSPDFPAPGLAKPIPDSVLGESEGRSHAVLLEEEQLAGVERQKGKSRSIIACESKKWSLMFLRKVAPDKIHFNLFRCKSWRCDSCSAFVRQKDYARMERGFQANPGQYIFAVLTFNQRKWNRKEDAYKAISTQTNKLVKRLEREYGKIVGVIAIEQHANGWPHVNLVFKFKEGFVMDAEFVSSFEKRWLIPNAVACGFGKMNTASLVKDEEVTRVLSYVSKTGLNIVGEINKASQIPINAPKGFRRLRSIRGFLVNLKKEAEYTGEIVKSNIETIDKLNIEFGADSIIQTVIRKYPQASSAKDVSIIKTEVNKTIPIIHNINVKQTRREAS